MGQQSEHGRPARGVERPTMPEDSHPSSCSSSSTTSTTSTQLLAQKNAREVIGKIVSTNFSYLTAGLNDAALGVLIPYIQLSYNIGFLQVSFIYLTNFAGWICASFANIHVCSHLGPGRTLVLGAFVQCIGFALMLCSLPFPLFVAAFFFTGCGLAFQDAQVNSFTITVRDSHRWLGILHGVYGIGTIVAPLIANTIASFTQSWHVFYLLTFIIGLINISLLAWTFRHDLFQSDVRNAKNTVGSELRATLSDRTVWLLNGFFFLYVGAEVTTGGITIAGPFSWALLTHSTGWLVQFLVSVRNGDPVKVGYIASTFWAGLTLGRVLLADITHQLGERRMVFIYVTLAVALQLVFWLIPNIIANAITICFLGFFIGPFYPVGLYVLTEVLSPDLHIGAIGFTASIGQAGSAAFPFLTGAIASHAGLQVLQPVMVGLLIGVAIFWALVPKQRSVRLT